MAKSQMPDFDDYRADTGANNLIIQRALREVDTEVLATALAGLPEDLRQIFYRNMSGRTTAICKEEIQTRQHKTGESRRIDAARLVLLRLLHKHGQESEGEELRPDETPEIRLGSHEELIATFCSLAAYVRKNGFLPLEIIEPKIEDPLVRKGIQFLVDGTEPMLARSILEQHKKTLLRNYETRLDIILDGIDTLATRYLPQVVEDKLRAHIPSS